MTSIEASVSTQMDPWLDTAPLPLSNDQIIQTLRHPWIEMDRARPDCGVAHHQQSRHQGFHNPMIGLAFAPKSPVNADDEPNNPRGGSQPSRRPSSANGPTSVKILIADLNLPRSTMTAVVDRLEARGLVNRLPNLEDRRSVMLEATPTASVALEKYREGMQSFVEHLEGVLEAGEREQLIRLIEKISASF